MAKLQEINSFISSLVWGWPLIILLLGTGLILAIRTRWIVVRKFIYMMKETFLRIFHSSDTDDGDLTPFQAVSTALAATVGTGNIAGVALAIAVGGPGAVFWIWFSAFLGMFTKYSEVVLAIEYREKSKETGQYAGGPMYYLEKGLNLKWLGVLFAIFATLASFGIGNMTQSNSVAQTLKSQFNISPWLVGLVLMVVSALVIIGGIKRIGSFTEKLVPIMAIFYIGTGLVILALNLNAIPTAFASIFKGAFTGSAAIGGFAGSTLMIAMRQGIARGLFTNEAGLGSGPIAHAAAKTDHPVKQGMWGVFEVFVDSFLVCTMTALVVLISGQWHEGLQGAALTTQSFETAISGGGYIAAISLSLFAFSTIIGWYYYGEKCVEYLFGNKATVAYKVVFIALIFVGAIGGLETVWAFSDTFNGLMAIPNLIGLVGLSGVVAKLTKNYFDQVN